MTTNNVKLAWRNLAKNKTFSALNLLGLTLGTACCLYILLYVQDQNNYDRYHHDAQNLYRVRTTLDLPDRPEPMKMATIGPPIIPTIKAEFPEVDVATRVCIPPGVNQNLFRVGDKVFFEKKGYLVDSTFFSVFDYPFRAGNPVTALNEPYSVVISEKLALKLFNTTDALGQSVRIGGSGGEAAFKITGVFGPPAGKSHLESEFFMTLNSFGIGQYVRTDDSWAGNNFIYGYLRLKDRADARALEAKLPDMLQRHGAEQLRQLNIKKTLHLQAIGEIHTTTEFSSEPTPGVSHRLLNILLLIAGFIQLIACINFMNLSTARATRRAQEVGVRKAIGAARSALVGQFLSESMLLSALAVATALPLVAFAMPWLNRLTGADIAFNPAQNPAIWLTVSALVLLTGLLAGSYPAFYLSSFNPIAALRSAAGGNRRGGVVWLRKGLVTTQFIIASLLIVGALVVRFQLDYMLEKDLGFEKNQKVVIPFRTTESRRQLAAFRNELTRLPEVQAASGMAVVPGQAVVNDIPLFKEGGDMNSAVDVRYIQTDENFAKTLKIKLLAGRFFMPSDTPSQFGIGKMVLNETALKQLGIPLEDAPGVLLRSQFRDMKFEMTVVGVIQDFHYQTLGKKIEPFALACAPTRELQHLVTDVDTRDFSDFFKKTETLWKSILPGMPFEYSFLDQDVEKLYRSEKNLAGIIGAFTGIAILISCLGLFGLAAFTAEQRTKEIGVRKVLGASVAGITALLAKDFIKLVLIALIVATPLAWWVMDQWLKDFAYRIEMKGWMFALAGFIAVAIAFLTVAGQSIKAALANPVKSLRSE